MSATSSHLSPWKRRRRALRGWSLVVLALTALTLAPRVLIPQGFMPSGAGFSLVVCPDGLTPAVTAIFAGDGAHAAHQAHQAHHDHAPPVGDLATPSSHDDTGRSPHGDAALSTTHCAFAVAAFIGPLQQIDVVLDDVDLLPILPDRAVSAPITTLAYRPQQARAPPQHS
jgi:hypothetical protein